MRQNKNDAHFMRQNKNGAHFMRQNKNDDWLMVIIEPQVLNETVSSWDEPYN